MFLYVCVGCCFVKKKKEYEMLRSFVGEGRYTRDSIFFFQAEDGIRDLVRSRGLGDVCERQSIDRNGLLRELSEGCSVHGRMYTHSSLAFSSGENCGRGTLAKDQVGKCGRGRASQHQR